MHYTLSYQYSKLELPIPQLVNVKLFAIINHSMSYKFLLSDITRRKINYGKFLSCRDTLTESYVVILSCRDTITEQCCNTIM